MCSRMLRISNVAKGDKPRTCKVMGGYLNATSFAKFTGHLIPAPKVSSWKEGRNGEKKVCTHYGTLCMCSIDLWFVVWALSESSSFLCIMSKNVLVQWDSFISSFCSIIFIYIVIVLLILGDNFVFLLFQEFHDLCYWTSIYCSMWLAILWEVQTDTTLSTLY